LKREPPLQRDARFTVYSAIAQNYCSSSVDADARDDDTGTPARPTRTVSSRHWRAPHDAARTVG